MKNYFNNLWFGAVLYPSRWLYALSKNPLILFGITAVLVCLLLFWFTAAFVVGIIILSLWFKAVIMPNKHFVLSLKGKKLCIQLFFIGAKPDKHRFNTGCQKGIFRSFVLVDGTYAKQAENSFYILGYDESLSDVGFLLYKTSKYDWNLISEKYYNGLFLGRRRKENCFLDTRKSNSMIATLLHGDTAVRYEVEDIYPYPHYFYDRGKAKFLPIASCKPQKPIFCECSDLLIKSKGRYRLFLFGISKDKNVPMAFLVAVQYVYRTDKLRYSSRGPIMLSSEDWSFTDMP